jgi:hypothetical protein
MFHAYSTIGHFAKPIEHFNLFCLAFLSTKIAIYVSSKNIIEIYTSEIILAESNIIVR